MRTTARTTKQANPTGLCRTSTPRGLAAARRFSDSQLDAGSVLSSAPSAFVCAAAAATTDGKPSQTFLKDLIRVGTYINPADGQAFDVTIDDLDHWAAMFSLMDANGVRVPVPEGHTTEAAANRGYVRGMFRDGDVLRGKIELIGPDAIALAGRNDVSVYVPPAFTDGKGNKYARPITHVAITSYPVVSGLKPFVPIAASLDGVVTQVPVLTLAAPGANIMEALLKIAAALGIPTDGLDETALTDAITAKCGEMATEMSNAKAAAAKADGALAASLAAKNAKPDPQVLKLTGRVRSQDIAALVTSGHATPACAKALSAAFVDGDAIALSLDPANDARFDAVIAALKANDPKELAEKFNSQSIALSRVTPDNTKPDAAAEAALIARLAR